MDFLEFKDDMILYSKQMNIMFSDKQINQFYKYMNLLIKWNEKINLTAITEPKDIILKHFIDSLTVDKYIKNEELLVDVGTGAGFPGIPIKIFRPDIRVVLVDSLNKRINFLNEVINELELQKIEAIHSRVEEFGKNKNYREKFDIVTARAVANLSVLSEYLLPLVKIGGKCICMKGNEIEQELDNSKNAIKTLGGKVNKVEKFKLPESDINRHIIIIDKIKDTPSKFPRKPGIPSKEPIV